MGSGGGQEAGGGQVGFQASISVVRDSNQVSVGAEMGKKPGTLIHHTSEGWRGAGHSSTEIRDSES